jgi:hypothetical protein
MVLKFWYLFVQWLSAEAYSPGSGSVVLPSLTQYKVYHTVDVFGYVLGMKAFVKDIMEKV